MVTINRTLLPVKAHYFLFYGGMAGVVPYVLTLFIQMGVTPTVIGTVYAILPFVKMVSKPLFGSVADTYRQHKSMFIVCKALMTSGLVALYFVHAASKSVGQPDRAIGPNTPYFVCQTSDTYDVIWECHNNKSNNNYNNDDDDNNNNLISPEGLPRCIGECNHTGQDKNCTTDEILLCGALGAGNKRGNPIWRTITDYADAGPDSVAFLDRCSNHFEVPSQNLNHSYTIPVCLSETSDSRCVLNCTLNSLDGPPLVPFQETGMFAFMIGCMVIAWAGMAVAENTGDVLTLELLDEEKTGYGKQRVWGSISWGMLAVVAGQLIDHYSIGKEYLDFTPGFIMALAVGILDVIVSMQIKVREMAKTENMMRNIRNVFRKPEIVVFTLEVFAVGCFTGVLWTFLIIYLNSMGASQLLIGLSMASQCFLGEMPFFFVADWLLKKVGHARAMILTFAVFAIRFELYYLMTNPWFVLVIEISQGINFGLFYTLLATYASIIAPPGTAATVQGIEQAVFEGFGVGLGSLGAGVLYEHLGGASMFLFFAVLSVACTILSVMARLWLHSFRKKQEHFLADEASDVKRDNELSEMLPPKKPPEVEAV